jgi:hypothetical protein
MKNQFNIVILKKGNVYSLLQNNGYLHGAQYVNPGQQLCNN